MVKHYVLVIVLVLHFEADGGGHGLGVTKSGVLRQMDNHAIIWDEMSSCLVLKCSFLNKAAHVSEKGA